MALQADDTTALSCYHLTSFTKNELLQPWAHFIATLPVFAHQWNTWIQLDHIKGTNDSEPDHLTYVDSRVVPS